ncbi:hypothetical protein PoB_002049800 [Plakobranchus ocellatus]|uniref:Uncharacterized protein n=1 Tax=Plakobranchus ocellatus TaxID=259542 RepID=A0AAV3ZGR6_9GAST|nr:hypothetical protein PoB_002049800 [Plakobranchus ocellatus]
MVSRIMRGHVMAAPFPLSDRATDVRPGCKTQRIAPTLQQVADLMCARIKEREYFKTCIVGHVDCCLQCGPTLRLASVMRASPLPIVAVFGSTAALGGANTATERVEKLTAYHSVMSDNKSHMSFLFGTLIVQSR